MSRLHVDTRNVTAYYGVWRHLKLRSLECTIHGDMDGTEEQAPCFIYEKRKFMPEGKYQETNGAPV